MTGTRQLAVIMFTDIVGYTAMMQQDESAALLGMNKYKDSLQRNVGQFDGEIIQYFGGSADHGEPGPQFSWPIRRKHSGHTVHAA